MDYGIIAASVVALGGLGILFALVLAAANSRFAAKHDPVADRVLAALPGANCGACGYGGCMAYAEAAAAGKIPPDACIPGGGPAAEKVAGIVGGAVRPRAPRVAVARCNRKSRSRVDYRGVKDCKAAMVIADNTYACSYACIGLGTCSRACPFGAIRMSEARLAVVDPRKCTGCGVCVKACPKGILSVERNVDYVHVLCRSRDRGAMARESCNRACTACGKCANVCPAGAIEIEGFLARIDYNKCTACGLCVTACPAGVISDSRDKTRRRTDAA